MSRNILPCHNKPFFSRIIRRRRHHCMKHISVAKQLSLFYLRELSEYMKQIFISTHVLSPFCVRGSEREVGMYIMQICKQIKKIL